MLSEAGGRVIPCDPMGEIGRRARSRILGVHPSAAIVVALAGLFAGSVAVRSIIGAHVHGPFFFMDELGYEQMARSFARTGHFALFNKPGMSYSPLYPVVLSPIYALTSTAQGAYAWVKVVNAVLLSLSVFPVYAIARFVLSRRQSLGVAALALLAPLVSYSSLELSENLAYPLCLLAIWAMLRALSRPSARNDVLLLAAIVLASAARLQLVALLPAALTAILLVALVPSTQDGRTRAALRAVSQHRVLFGTVAVALVAGLARTATNGGNLPLAGRYANVGSSSASPSHAIWLTVQHLAALDLMVAVVPFGCALAAAYVLAASGFPRKALLWGAVATSTTLWFVLEVGFDAAAFDKTYRLSTGVLRGDVPRIHERYLIYLVPFFLVALVALVRHKGKAPARVHLVIAAVIAALPAVIPFARDINYTSFAESPSLQILGTVKHGVVVPIAHPTATAARSLHALRRRLPGGVRRHPTSPRPRLHGARLCRDLVHRDGEDRERLYPRESSGPPELGRSSGGSERDADQRCRCPPDHGARDGV